MHDEVAPQRNSWIGLKRIYPRPPKPDPLSLSCSLPPNIYSRAGERVTPCGWLRVQHPFESNISTLALLSIESRDGTRLFPIVESNFEYSSFLPRECNNSRDKILPLPCLFRGMGLKKKRRRKKRKRRKGDYRQ